MILIGDKRHKTTKRQKADEKITRYANENRKYKIV